MQTTPERKTIRRLTLLLLLGAATSCSLPASWVAGGLAGSGFAWYGFQRIEEVNTVRRLTDVEFAARPPDYPIAVTGGDYENPYREIAIVTSRAYDARRVEKAGVQDLQQKARQLGGDAVVQVVHNGVVTEKFAYRPGSLTRYGTRFEPAYTLTGIVVRFER